MADAIERQTIIVRNQVGKLWKRSQITKGAETVRSLLSSVVGVEAAVILIEAYGLQFETVRSPFAELRIHYHALKADNRQAPLALRI
jgi:hypothetical protein